MIPQIKAELWAKALMLNDTHTPMIILTSGNGRHLKGFTDNPYAVVVSYCKKAEKTVTLKGKLIFTPGETFDFLFSKDFPINIMDAIVPAYCPIAEDNPTKEEFSSWAHKFASAWLSARQLSFSTLVESNVWATNTIENARNPFLWNAPSIEQLKETFAGRSAVIVGAGPSLTDNDIDEIGKLRGKTIIICVNSICKRLVNRGVIPHFCVAVDGRENAYKGVEGLPALTSPQGPILICPFQVFPKIPSCFAKAFTFGMSPVLAFLFGQSRKFLPELPLGGSVIVSTVAFAKWIGCVSATLFGVDFAFAPDGTVISKGTYNEGVKKSAKESLFVPGNFLESVPTDSALQTYRNALESVLDGLARAGASFKVFNASQTGARIKGAEPIKASKFFKEAPQGPSFDPALIAEETKTFPATTFKLQLLSGLIKEALGVVTPWYEKFKDPKYEDLAGIADTKELCHKTALRLMVKDVKHLQSLFEKTPFMEEAIQSFGLRKYLIIATRKYVRHFKGSYPHWVIYNGNREMLIAYYYGLTDLDKTITPLIS